MYRSLAQTEISCQWTLSSGSDDNCHDPAGMIAWLKVKVLGIRNICYVLMIKTESGPETARGSKTCDLALKTRR